MSVTSPATAKNCITVGACESERPAFDANTYGAWWPSDYPAAPYRSDPIANNPDQVAAFSSRGVHALYPLLDLASFGSSCPFPSVSMKKYGYE